MDHAGGRELRRRRKHRYHVRRRDAPALLLRRDVIDTERVSDDAVPSVS